jgi:hypothetical protein
VSLGTEIDYDILSGNDRQIKTMQQKKWGDIFFNMDTRNILI